MLGTVFFAQIYSLSYEGRQTGDGDYCLQKKSEFFAFFLNQFF